MMRNEFHDQMHEHVGRLPMTAEDHWNDYMLDECSAHVPLCVYAVV